ncbi:MAG: hypothetical protein ISN29_08220, partial [Gammaproteobacteria bacterium AqS3]|nr:hypothetical protein [Gammaproteobacteria bacterium AqS3]
MDNFKTRTVDFFGVSFLSRTRIRRKTSALSFSLTRRLLFAGALLLGMVFSIPVWGIPSPSHPPNVITHNLNLETDSLAVKEGTSRSFRIGVPSPGLDAFFGLKFKLTSGSNSGALEFDIDPNTPGNQHFLTVWGSQSVSVQVKVTAAQDANRINEVVEVGFSIWDHPENALINPHHQKTVYLNSQKVVVTAIDDDDPAVGLKLSRTSITMDEGASETFTVRLKSKPYNTRTVNLASTNSDVTVNKTSLTFTPTNWSQTQTVTVRAAHDADGVNDTATINLTGNRINTASVGVTVIDDDVGLILSSSSLTVVEGGSKTFRAKLSKNPGGTRTVTLASTNSDVTVNKTSLTFTTSNWNAYQTVRVYAAHDSDKVDDTARINLTGTRVVTGSVNVTVIDDDVELTLSTSSLTIQEGGSKTFTVRLATWPGNNRTINLSSTNSDVTVDTNTSATGNQTVLTFTASNWNTAQTVTVRAAHDADGVNDTATISLTGSKVNTASVGVTVIDDDVGLILSPSSLTIIEGGSKTFRAKLSKNPGGTRTVTLASNNTDVTVDTKSTVVGKQNSLTFTTSNWNAYQTVRVYAA